MKVLRSINGLSTSSSPIVLAIGVFDGVHIGHRAVIQRALHDAAACGGYAVVVTFDPHPVRILRPELAPRLLTCNEHKQQIIARLGVETLLVLPFDRDMAATPPETFIRQLQGVAPGLRQICVGAGWAFGKERAGNLELLQKIGVELGFSAVGVTDVSLDGQPVSSTAVRAAVEKGELDSAAKMLGRDFSILGTVKEGRQLGRELGFPTANLQSNNEQLPPNGVYGVSVRLLEHGEDGELVAGIANVGIRPTVSDSQERGCEVHLFDYAGDLYGKDIEVFFESFVREEKKFTSVEELRAQIAQDIETVKSRTAHHV